MTYLQENVNFGKAKKGRNILFVGIRLETKLNK